MNDEEVKSGSAVFKSKAANKNLNSEKGGKRKNSTSTFVLE